MEQALREQGLQPEALPAARDWNEVEPELAASMRITQDEREKIVEGALAWPAALTTDWIKERFGREVDALTLGEVEAMALDHNLHIEDRTHAYCDQLDQSIADSWSQQGYRRGLYALPPRDPASLGSAFHMRTQMSGQWVVTMELDSERHAHVVEQRAGTRELVNGRDWAIARYLRE